MQASDSDPIDLVRRSGLVVLDWYLARNSDVAAAGVDPIEHWYYLAQAELRDPNFLFSLQYVGAEHQKSAQAALNPLVHYIQSGEAQGAAPSIYFDPHWYRERYAADIAAAGFHRARPLPAASARSAFFPT